jgi:hypothetical protein
VDCRCNEVTELHGAEAEAYLAGHLRSSADGTYACADTGARWQVDEQTDPGQPRLVRLQN